MSTEKGNVGAQIFFLGLLRLNIERNQSILIGGLQIFYPKGLRIKVGTSLIIDTETGRPRG